MLKKLEDILNRKKDALTLEWAQKLAQSSTSYGRRPQWELRQTTRRAFEANLEYIFRNNTGPLDGFIDFIVTKRLSARFKLSEVMKAFELFRTVARPAVICEVPKKDVVNALELLDLPVNYAVNSFSERYQTRHEEQLIGINRHLTEALGQLKVEKQNALAANALKDQFMANVSHELRTPLTSIIGFSRLLVDSGELAEQHSSKLRIIYNQGKSLLHIINTIMMISEINAGTACMREDAIDLMDMVEHQAKQIKKHPLAKNHRINLSSKAKGIMFKGDSEKLNALFFELMFNAIKFSEKESDISIDCGEKNGQLFFSIRDQGIGIEKNKQESIFAPFFQLDGSTTRRFGGSGLGLTMAKLVTEMHNGEIAVESSPGLGSEFTVKMPYRPVIQKKG